MMRIRRISHVAGAALFALACVPAFACGGPIESEGEQTGAAAEAIVSVGSPTFSVPSIGYWCSAVYPNAGWTFIYGAPGDINANPCSGANGVSYTRTGMYSTGTNIAEVWCSPNYYWIYQGQGTSPLAAAYHDASTTQTQGNCVFKVTIGSSLRQPPVNPPAGYPLQYGSAMQVPAAATSYAFDANRFATKLEQIINTPTSQYPHPPVGYQLVVRDPQGNIVRTDAPGSTTTAALTQNPPYLPATGMSATRRFDVASVSKTITATALVAAIEDLNNLHPGETSLNVNLDSSIKPYLPAAWPKASTVGDITFRMLLSHTSGFCPPNGGDKVADLKPMIQSGPAATKGVWDYCNANYALMRLLIPYLVDGPQAYASWENDPKFEQVTALSYRNYVRGRIFAKLGLSGIDDFYTGPSPETIYYDTALLPIKDNVNITSSTPNIDPCNGYDETANNMVLTAGSGNWTLSAEEMTLFLSNLWRGQIVSPTSVVAMVPRNFAGNWLGFGSFGSRPALGDGTLHDNLNEGGGGYCANGGPTSHWETFFNGYSFALFSNTATSATDIGVIDDTAKHMFVPSAWTRSVSWYWAADGCDCNSGAWDPDCDDPTQTLFWCAAGQHCQKVGSTGVCTN